MEGPVQAMQKRHEDLPVDLGLGGSVGSVRFRVWAEQERVHKAPAQSTHNRCDLTASSPTARCFAA